MEDKMTSLMEKLQWYTLEHPENEDASRAVRTIELVVLTGELFNLIIKNVPKKKAQKLGIYDDVETLFAKYVNIVDGLSFEWDVEEGDL